METPDEVEIMSEDIYVKPGERLNQNLAGLGAVFATGAHTLKPLAKQLNRDEAGKEIVGLGV